MRAPAEMTRALNNVSATRYELEAAVTTFQGAAFRGVADGIEESSAKAHEALERHLEAIATAVAVATTRT